MKLKQIKAELASIKAELKSWTPLINNNRELLARKKYPKWSVKNERD
jgi:hypothetical protein